MTKGHPALSHSQRVRAARRVRRWFGPAPFDAMLGAGGRDQAVERLLANQPVVGVESVQDGLDLLAVQRRDHPGGTWVERLGTVVGWARNVCVTVFMVYALAMVVTAVIVSESGDGEEIFEDLAAWLGISAATLVIPLLVLLGVTVFLHWCAAGWPHALALSEVRHAVRWAADRPGQAARGIPLVAPFAGLGPWLLGPAIVCWVVGGFLLIFVLWFSSSEGDWSWGVAGLVLALGLLGPVLQRGWAALRRATWVANEHLLLLREREYALWVDPATALRERFLILSEGIFDTTNVQERTVYPLTAHLSREDLHRLRDENALLGEVTELTLIGERDQTPVVTRGEQGDPDSHGFESHLEDEYAGGWLVAEARETDRGALAWIVVPEAPERFATEVLPQFGDRSGLDPDSLRLLQVPSDGPWLTNWVKNRVPQG